MEECGAIGGNGGMKNGVAHGLVAQGETRTEGRE